MLSGYWLVKTFEDYLYYNNIVNSKSTTDTTIDAKVDAKVDANVDANVDVKVDTNVDATNKKEYKTNYEQMLYMFNTHLFNDNTIID